MTDVTAALADALRDRYGLERELGQGGMATVYLAEDVRHHRQVAVKVLRAELAATLGSDRFFREIEVAARLQHPHILPLLDSGEAGGFYYYVMPYVAGESLRERLARVGELPVHEAVKILAEVVDALAAAHAMGVVHRDIKPDNVMLSGRHALVMDFGVAKAVSEATGRNKLTTAGVALGTPSYMAPEQAAADPHLDHRVDIYAVGTMGYELLTGHPPFTGVSSQEILAAHMTRAPEPIASRRPAVPPVLAAVIMKCLEKRPADRYQTAEELLTQLELLATPSGGMTPTQTRPIRGIRRLRAIPLIASGMAVLLAAGFAGWWTFARPGVRDEPPRIVVLPPKNVGAADQAYLADGFAEEISHRLVSLGGLEVIGRTSAERYRGTTLTPRQIGAELRADYLLALRIGREGPEAGSRIRLSAELVRAASEAQVWGKSYQASVAADYFRVQQDVAEQVAGEMGVTLGATDRQKIERRPTENREAYDFFLRGNTILRSHYSAPLFLEAAGFLERAVALDPHFAQAWAALGLAHMEIYWVGGASRRLELARRAIDRAQSLAPRSEETQYALGIYYYYGFLDFPSALEHLRDAARTDSGRAEFHEAIGYVHRRAGEFGEAAKSLERARRLDPGNARILRSLAETFGALGRPQDAMPLITRAVELNPGEFWHHAEAIRIFIQMNRLAQARMAAQSALVRPGLTQMLSQVPLLIPDLVLLLPDAERKKVASSYPPLAPEFGDTGGYYLSRAEVFSLTGQDSRPSYDSAAAAFQRKIAERPDAPWAHAGLGQAYRGLGRREEAIRAFRRGVELVQGRDFYEGPYFRAWLARTYLAFGERDSAAVEFGKYVASYQGNRLEARYHPVYAALRELPQVRELLER